MFVKILALTNLPDIRPAVESGEMTFGSIWKLRQSRTGRRFREWLTQAAPESAEDMVQLYLKSIVQPSLMEPVPARIIGLGLLTALGIWHSIVGGAIGLPNSLFTEKLIKGYRPKLMFNDLSRRK